MNPIESNSDEFSDDELNQVMDKFESEKNQVSTSNQSNDKMPTRQLKLIPDNMLRYVQCTPDEILKKKCAAKIKIITKKKGTTWFINRMQWDFYPIHTWPATILDALLHGDLRYKCRLQLASFFHGNGYEEPHIIMGMFEFYNADYKQIPFKNYCTRVALFTELFPFLEKIRKGGDASSIEKQTRYWYYNMNTQLTQFYDGFVKTANGQRVRFIQHDYAKPNRQIQLA